MQCFICMTYLMIIATAHPPKIREISKALEKRSIFNDVIKSLRIRSQLPEDDNLNDENNLGLNYDKYGLENESLQQPNDFDFLPRRNDRIEMPTLKYRFPKSLQFNETDSGKAEEIVLYVNTPADNSEPDASTQRSKKPTRTPSINRNKTTTIKNRDTNDSYRPFMNNMKDQSQIGNRESQTIVKPTVIVNLGGSVMHRESDIRLEKKPNYDIGVMPQNIFNIHQDINVERTETEWGNKRAKKAQNVKQEFDSRKVVVEEDMMMCETAAAKEKDSNNRSSRKHDVLQIMFTI